MPEPEASLSLSQLWDKEEVVIGLSTMATMGRTMEDIFGIIHQEGQQTDIVPLVVVGEGTDT